MTEEQLRHLEIILYRENSIIDPDDVDLLMAVVTKEMAAQGVGLEYNTAGHGQDPFTKEY